jgi:hypothetical protein
VLKRAVPPFVPPESQALLRRVRFSYAIFLSRWAARTAIVAVLRDVGVDVIFGGAGEESMGMQIAVAHSEMDARRRLLAPWRGRRARDA